MFDEERARLTPQSPLTACRRGPALSGTVTAPRHDLRPGSFAQVDADSAIQTLRPTTVYVNGRYVGY